MIKAVAPITGGAIWPPFDATASMAPAYSGLKPVFFMRGIVTIPVDIILPTVDPEIVPNALDATTATFAGPPRR